MTERDAPSDSTSDDTRWQIVGLSHDLGPKSVLAGFTDAADMALWRDEQGKAHAFDVRCPHRGMRLSYGFVRNNRLACPYHGWQYAEDGHCAYIPAHPQLPPSRSICAAVYSCKERYGLIWASVDPTDSTPHVPALDELDIYPARSFVLKSPFNRVRNTLLTASREINSPSPVHPNIVTLQSDSRNTTHTLICALQSIGEKKTGLHLLAGSQPSEQGTAPGQVKQSIARWGVRLRRQLEACAQKTQ